MKKVLVLVAATALFGSAAFAEKVAELGMKGGLLLNAGTKIFSEDKFDTAKEEWDDYADKKMLIGGDVGIFGHFGLVEIGKGALSLQPEAFLSLRNGLVCEKGNDWYTGTSKIYYNSLDIAVLIGYDIQLGKARLTPFLGPKLGIPIGGAIFDQTWTHEEGDDDDYWYGTKMKGVTIGMDFGVGFAIPLGKSFVLGADVRYGIDFNKTKANVSYWDEDEEQNKTIETEFLRRGALGINITAGWRF